MNGPDTAARLQAELGLKRLTPGFAKLEIVLGLAGAWAGALLLVRVGPGFEDVARLAATAVLFILGGYRALAGSRSHLHQSNNLLAAYLANQIRPARLPTAP